MYNNKIVIQGGYYEDPNEPTYYGDIWQLDLNTNPYQWSRLWSPSSYSSPFYSFRRLHSITIHQYKLYLFVNRIYKFKS